MVKLEQHKTTVQVTGTNHHELLNTIQVIGKKHNVRITRTDLINIAISELYKDIGTGNKSLLEVLSNYNLL